MSRYYQKLFKTTKPIATFERLSIIEDGKDKLVFLNERNGTSTIKFCKLKEAKSLGRIENETLEPNELQFVLRH